MKFHKYDDPGHGWLKVTHKQFQNALAVNPKMVGTFMTATAVFLEEDCDATSFIKSLIQRDIKWEVETHHTNKQSKVRNYGRYDASFLGGLKIGDKATLWDGRPFEVVGETRSQFVIIMDTSVKYRLPKNTFTNYLLTNSKK